jgi:phosphoribosyl 1,2-cyclic phosphate phosphodiesterase
VRVEILGSAGAVPTPRPGYDCRVCTGARDHGGRHARTGPSVFEIAGDGRRVLLALDELKGWEPEPALRGLDLAVLPMGLCEHDPFTGERRIHQDHSVLRLEATLPETLGIVERLGAARVVLAHMEEIDGLTYDDHVRLGAELGVEFAYDGMQVEI